MPNKRKSHGTGCPVAFALDIFGDRWSLLIIRNLMLRGEKTFGEFLSSEEGIATNILTERLKTLEAAGIISKSDDPESGRRKIYALTDKGLDLAPVVIEIIRWSGRHDACPEARKAVFQMIEADSDAVLADIQARRPISASLADASTGKAK